MAFDILIVDDEVDIRELVSGILSDEGYSTRTAGCFVDALEAVRGRAPHLIILDVWLGEGDRDGIRLLETIKKEHRHVPVIMMSGHGTIETAVSAIKRGAHDFIEKPFDSNRLIMSVEKAIETSKLRQENEELKIKAGVSENILGESPNAVYIRQSVERIAPLSGRCVIIGATGSDKETIAREIHKLSPQAKNQFGVLNCQAFSQKQLEIELFGVQITGEFELNVKHGIIERVSGGTLFLDEITSLSSDLQARLLKMLKDGYFFRIGANAKIPTNVRIIAGVGTDIENQVKNRLFSDELFCRLNANTIKVAPLQLKREDIPLLLNHFIEQSAKAYNIAPRRFSSEALSVLCTYSWPGDVMQLKNVVDYILVNGISQNSNNIIMIEDLPKEITEGKTASGSNSVQFISSVSELSIKEAREAFEREYFIEQLRRFSGNISQTSKFVGMERSALHRKLRSLNITDSKASKCSGED